MRDYGKVHTSFWASDTLRDLDSDAKLLALYLLTSPHTHMAGVFSLPDAYACHDLGVDNRTVSERFRNPFGIGVAAPGSGLGLDRQLRQVQPARQPEPAKSGRQAVGPCS